MMYEVCRRIKSDDKRKTIAVLARDHFGKVYYIPRQYFSEVDFTNADCYKDGSLHVHSIQHDIPNMTETEFKMEAAMGVREYLTFIPDSILRNAVATDGLVRGVHVNMRFNKK